MKLNILRKLFLKEQPKILGRWRLNHNEVQLNRKVYLANYDHCGPCGIIELGKKEVDYIKLDGKKML